jgi:hypothetical protein
MIPVITNWQELKTHLYIKERERGQPFALGMEIGWGEHENPAGSLKRRLILGNDDQLALYDQSLFAAGKEYGELLAETANPQFLRTAQEAYPPVEK